MCWVLYLAADRELPLVPWTEQSPAFNVHSLPEAERGVTVQFSKSHVYAVGAHTASLDSPSGTSSTSPSGIARAGS